MVMLTQRSAALDPPPAQGKEGDKQKEPKLELTKLEQEILDLTNQERKKEGLPPLKPNEKLFQAARAHSQNMAKQDKLHHVLDGKDPIQRAKEVGHSGFVAENIAWGARSAPEVVRMWMGSPGHKANILDKRAVEVGIGVASARSGPYYTMVFGLQLQLKP
jgi:uncharacterized protein YkwD